MLTLLMWAVCLLVILKGADLLQFALATAGAGPRWRSVVTWIGIVSFVVAVLGASVLAYQFTLQANQAARALEPLMR